MLHLKHVIVTYVVYQENNETERIEIFIINLVINQL